jgi:hypothetical protein
MPNLLKTLTENKIFKIKNSNKHINGINKNIFMTHKLNLIANYNLIINERLF